MYLGHLISKDGIQPSQSKLEAVINAPKPSNVSQLKAFLGLVNYYSRFLKNLAIDLQPLYKLLQKNICWKWGKDQREAFKKVKNKIKKPLLLIHYDPTKSWN